MQMSLHTASSAELYIANHEWRAAALARCPLHPQGGCSFARHGSYARVTPSGLRVARWYCPEGHRTFSLLPDFLAARLPGLLDTIDACVAAVHSAKSVESAADGVRGPEVTLPGAICWLRRRVRAVRTGLAAVADLMPELSVGIGQAGFLRGLRRSLPMTVLACTPAPLGFGARTQIGHAHVRNQHEVGPDRPVWPGYGRAFSPASAPCDANLHPRCPRQPSRPSTTCSASGTRTDPCKTRVRSITFDGLSGFASMLAGMAWKNVPS